MYTRRADRFSEGPTRVRLGALKSTRDILGFVRVLYRPLNRVR